MNIHTVSRKRSDIKSERDKSGLVVLRKVLERVISEGGNDTPACTDQSPRNAGCVAASAPATGHTGTEPHRAARLAVNTVTDVPPQTFHTSPSRTTKSA